MVGTTPGKSRSARDVPMDKREAKALLAALEWCDAAFGLGKTQKSVRSKVLEAFPKLS